MYHFRLHRHVFMFINNQHQFLLFHLSQFAVSFISLFKKNYNIIFKTKISEFFNLETSKLLKIVIRLDYEQYFICRRILNNKIFDLNWMLNYVFLFSKVARGTSWDIIVVNNHNNRTYVVMFSTVFPFKYFIIVTKN